MITFSPVNKNTNTHKGKQIGTVVGAGVGTGYLIKNGKDIFNVAIKEGLKGTDIPAKKVMPIAVLVATAAVGLIAGTGRLIGAGIGKLVDKHNAKKEMKEINTLKAAVMEKYPDGIPMIATETPEKMQELMNSKEYLKELLSL